MEAISIASTWVELQKLLTTEAGRAPSNNTLRRAVDRLKADTSAFSSLKAVTPPDDARMPSLEPKLSKAAEFIAAAWYSIAGADVLMASESRYDLIADFGGNLKRVQVKGTRSKSRGYWTVRLATARYDALARRNANGQKVHERYTADEVDEFFIVTGDFDLFRIPVDVPDSTWITLPGRYELFRVELGSWLDIKLT